VVSDEDDDAEAAMTGKGSDNGNRSNDRKTVKTAKVSGINEHKKQKEAQAKQASVKLPEKPDQNHIRVQKIRAIFTLSAKLGHTPDEMKAVIGNLIGLNRPIKESAEIKDTDLDTVIKSFEQEMKLKEAA
jgi:hypothetical protein